MTAQLPPLPGWMHIVLTIAQREATRDFAKLAVREALDRIVKKARANDWIEPTCDGSIVTFPLEDIEAMLKEYEG
jgi:hypothetical protein